jgi:hypothetical protein
MKRRGIVITLGSVLLLCAGLMLLGGYALGRFFHKASAGHAVSFVSQGPTIQKLEELGELVSLKVTIADVLEGSDRGWLGDITGVWLVKGEALLAVDMRQARFLQRDEQARTAILRLPQPHVLSARVDHARTRTYKVRAGWLRSGEATDALRDQAMRQAQQLIEQAAGQRENLELARTNVKKVLDRLFDSLGWTVQVEWE